MLENVLLNLILTIFGYLLVPIIVIIREKKYPKSKLKTIAVVNGFIVWTIFSFIIISHKSDYK